MRPVWLHDLRLAWRHPEILKDVIKLTAWKAAFWIVVGALLPIQIVLAAIYAVGAGIAAGAESVIGVVVLGPVTWLRNKRTPYYRPIREKLKAKGAMQWQIQSKTSEQGQ